MGELSFNLRIYQHLVKSHVDNEHDLKFVCNNLGKMYQEVQAHGCVDNIRVSKLVTELLDEQYQAAIDRGCCGSTDRRITNPVTGNKFIIGCNFGH